MIRKKFLLLIVSVLIIINTLTYIPPLSFTKNYVASASTIVVDTTNSQGINIRVSYTDTVSNGETTRTYTIRGLRLDDDPNVFNGYSMQHLYENNAPLTIKTALDNMINAHEQDEPWLKAHTGWSLRMQEYHNGRWINSGDGDINRYKVISTQNGFAGEVYNYNAVKKGLAELNGYFPEELKKAINNMSKTEPLFKVIGDSRAQNYRVWPKNDLGESSQLYYPPSARTNPKEGDRIYLYYNNDVFLEVNIPFLLKDICIPNVTEDCCEGEDCETEELCPSTGLPLPCPPPELPGCSIDIALNDGATMNRSDTDPTATGSIYSSNGEFDVVSGIPTSENLSATATSEEYLFEQAYKQQLGEITYNDVKVSQEITYQWTEGTETKEEVEKIEVTVSGIKRTFSYWLVDKFNVWKANTANIQNYALPGASVNLTGNTSVTASASTDKDINSHVFPADCEEIVLPPKTLEGEGSKPDKPDITEEGKAAAEVQIKEPKVKNDSVKFNGSTLMSNVLTEKNGSTPSNVPYANRIPFTRTNMLIDKTKTNYHRSPSYGMFNYNKVFSLSNITDKGFNFSVNDVTVHTPVVIYSKSSDDKEFDQRTNPPARSTPVDNNTEIAAFILDRPFTVSMPTTGQHRSIKGYGNKNYQKYTKEKSVKFPFDVYSETKQQFYPANTWIKVPVNIVDVKFFLPVWVKEGQYTIEFKSVAENAPSSNGKEEVEANITIPNGNVGGHASAAHTATDEITVDVVGRLYDFNITDITDYNWKDVFKDTDGITSLGTRYFTGLNNLDAIKRVGLTEKYTLPIRHGSHPNGYSNVAVKTGYTFRFDLKTKGDMDAENDAIRIKPTFSFVQKDGKNRQDVDLYYHDPNKKFVKVGSDEDLTYREVVLNHAQRNISETELIANADYYYRHKTSYTGMEELAKDQFNTSFARNYLRKYSQEIVKTGPYGWQMLNWKLRTFIGPEENMVPAGASVPAMDVIKSMQAWYGEYSIPANVYAVSKGTEVNTLEGGKTISNSNAGFLKDGYIIVNFDIETIDNGNLDEPRLQYINGPLVNQWVQNEGYKRSFVDDYGNTFQLKDGDVVFYHADISSSEDFNSSVTH